MVLKEIKILSFYHVNAISEQKWLFCAGEQPIWLPMVGHKLAKTHIYNSKHAPWELIGWWWSIPVCPWSSAWSLALLSLDSDQLYTQRSWVWLLLPSWAMMQLWTWMDTWLPLFSFSLSGLIPVAMGRAGSALPPCLGYKYKLRTCMVKPVYLLLCWSYTSEGLGAMWVPYNGWVRTCCSLTMAGACAKYRPCYWSQTNISKETIVNTNTIADCERGFCI